MRIANIPNVGAGRTGILLSGILIAFVSAVPLHAQGGDEEARQARNRLYFELLGNTGGYSLNFERAIVSRLAVRVGASYTRGDASYWFPVMAGWTSRGFGPANSRRLEAGVGVVIAREANCFAPMVCRPQTNRYPTFSAGLTEDVGGGPFFYRLGLTVTTGWNRPHLLGFYGDRIIPAVSVGAMF